MLGGAMRQSGILAAAGSFALRHNVERLAEDHAAARLLAERLAGCRGVTLDLETVQTNIVVFSVADAPAFVAACRDRGVLLNAFSPTLVRAVTHLNVDRDAIAAAADVMAEVAEHSTAPFAPGAG
jgi:threonine aldolase